MTTRRPLPGLALLAAAVLAGCGGAAPAPQGARPLSLSVGGSANIAGAVVSEPRTDAPGLRTGYGLPR